ncbi:DNA-formamidopyrimidine glycosylase family protein [Mucilaginibacter sp. PAMB04274]|uniref:DNA-formamidopyrimidine glycosylase family protein n=1 Tax=Mucilaginibacter sp. PAMB04274 TaxID=3138568 RepID=UPI0031F68FA9
MPELPDLQVFSRNLSHALKGLKLIKVNVVQSRKLNVPVKDLTKALEGEVLEDVIRSGKQLHFKFTNNQTLGVHLMLHGEIHWLEENTKQKFVIFELHFEGGKGIAVTDFQRGVMPTLNPDPAEAPDALDKTVNTNFWKTKFKARRTAVKKILMDQDVVRGIGNAYADEILYDAGISPFSVADKIPDDRVEALAKSVKKVLVDAEKQILKSNPSIISGEVRDFLKVHRPKQAATSDGAAIHMDTIASRKTYYTDKQQLFD